MRSLIFAIAVATAITACTSSPPAPEKSAAVPLPALAAPQCYSGDHGKFFDQGSRVAISGVEVVCEKSSDGKSAQWIGIQAKH